MEKFLQLAELKTEEAQKASIEKVEEIDDLDDADAPEKLVSINSCIYSFFNFNLIIKILIFKYYLCNLKLSFSLLLSVVSGAVQQDRMDRTVLSPWLRFLWDSYRNSLDLLRNNVYVEQLYHQIARQSFAFCAKYQRRNEFRKLCDLLRIHLGQIQKSQQLNHA